MNTVLFVLSWHYHESNVVSDDCYDCYVIYICKKWLTDRYYGNCKTLLCHHTIYLSSILRLSTIFSTTCGFKWYRQVCVLTNSSSIHHVTDNTRFPTVFQNNSINSERYNTDENCVWNRWIQQAARLKPSWMKRE